MQIGYPLGPSSTTPSMAQLCSKGRKRHKIKDSDVFLKAHLFWMVLTEAQKEARQSRGWVHHSHPRNSSLTFSMTHAIWKWSVYKSSERRKVSPRRGAVAEKDFNKGCVWNSAPIYRKWQTASGSNHSTAGFTSVSLLCVLFLLILILKNCFNCAFNKRSALRWTKWSAPKLQFFDGR